MDELFGNLIYLIPIALVIFRVLSAITGSAKKRQAREEEARRAGQNRAGMQPKTESYKNPMAEPGKAPEETLDPVMREVLRRFSSTPPPGKTTQGPFPPRPGNGPVYPAAGTGPARTMPSPARPRDENLPHWEREKTRPAPSKPPVKKTPVIKAAPELTPAFSALTPSKSVPAAAPPKPEQTQGIWQGQRGLSPLQQGFVWAEILGQPKAFY